MKNQQYLSIFTPVETLQRDYDNLKKQGVGNQDTTERIARLEQMVLNIRGDMLKSIKEELHIPDEKITDWLKIKTFQLGE